jgi:hypothetical protein
MQYIANRLGMSLSTFYRHPELVQKYEVLIQQKQEEKLKEKLGAAYTNPELLTADRMINAVLRDERRTV